MRFSSGCRARSPGKSGRGPVPRSSVHCRPFARTPGAEGPRARPAKPRAPALFSGAGFFTIPGSTERGQRLASKGDVVRSFLARFFFLFFLLCEMPRWVSLPYTRPDLFSIDQSNRYICIASQCTQRMEAHFCLALANQEAHFCFALLSIAPHIA